MSNGEWRTSDVIDLTLLFHRIISDEEKKSLLTTDYDPKKPGKKQFDRTSSDVFNERNEQSEQVKKTGKKRIDKVIDNDILGIRERNFSNEVSFFVNF